MVGQSSYSGTGDKVYTLKFVLAGSRGVGKTQLASLIHRKHGAHPSVGMQFATRTLRYAEHSCVRAQIWDTAGTFPFKSVSEAFFQGAVGAMVVYDISRRSTFDDLARWLALVRENCHESVALILVGNKSDMSSKQREVSMVEGMRFARKHGLDFMETSALEAEHVEEACRQLIMSVARYLPQEECVWTKHKPSCCPLPPGWVTIAPVAGEDEGEGNEENEDPKRCLPSSSSSSSGGAISALMGKATVTGDIGIDTDSDSDSTDVASTDTNAMPPPPPPPPPPASRRVPPKVLAGDHYGGNSMSNPQQRTELLLRTTSDSAATAAVAWPAAAPVAAAVRAGGSAKARGKKGKGGGGFEPPGRVSWYENTWTGERVWRRPVYPAGPSEACVVSQVPRPLGPFTFLADHVKADGGGGGGFGRKAVREVVGNESSWSFSSFKTRGVAAAALCLSQCVDTS